MAWLLFVLCLSVVALVFIDITDFPIVCTRPDNEGNYRRACLKRATELSLTKIAAIVRRKIKRIVKSKVESTVK